MKLLRNFSNNELCAFQKGQNIMTNILIEFDKICRDNDLEYWCVGGTLIGAVRHKGWIPYDGDIDVAMLESDYKKLQKIIQKNLSKDYWFQDQSTDKYYKSDVGKIRYLYAQYDDYKSQDWHNGIQLDIFVFTEISESNILKTNRNHGFYFGEKIKKQMIFPLKELVFENTKVYVPNNYEQYLINAWGGCPPPMLSDNRQGPHEGRISFTIPDWMTLKYSNLYKNKRLTLFSDGIFDLFHSGHLKHLKKIKDYFKTEVHIIVGIINDNISLSYKRKPIFSENQRKNILEACVYVDEVIIMDNLFITEEFMYLNGIDYVFHAFSDDNDADKQSSFYQIPVKQNKFIKLDYNHGISTSQILNNINLNWDDIWVNKGNIDTEDLYLLNGWEETYFNPKEFINSVNDILSIDGTDNIIEIGCGSGLLSQYFNKDTYIGIDKSLSLVNKNVKILNSTVINFSSTDIIFKNNHFDYCICNGMLEYLNNENELDKTMNNIERITKKGIYIGSIRYKTREHKEKKHKYDGIYTHFIIPKKYFEKRNYTIINNKYSDERYDAYKLLI
tara:strand:+ start:1410 stop:3083 length:1674 start_codon:yes stop_codon:yes gene_type:complete